MTAIEIETAVPAAAASPVSDHAAIIFTQALMSAPVCGWRSGCEPCEKAAIGSAYLVQEQLTAPEVETSVAEPEAPAEPETPPAPPVPMTPVMEAIRRVGAAAATAYADSLRFTLGVTGQAVAREWEHHWDRDLLPSTETFDEAIGCPSGPDITLELASVLSSVATLVTDRAESAQILRRALRVAHPGWPRGLDEAVAQSVASNRPVERSSDLDLVGRRWLLRAAELRRADENAAVTVAALSRAFNETLLGDEVPETLVAATTHAIEDHFRQVWARSMEAMDELAGEEDWCGQYEDSMDAILALTKTPFLSEPDRMQDVEGYATVTVTLSLSVPVSATVARGDSTGDALWSAASEIDSYEVMEALGNVSRSELDWDVSEVEESS